MIYKSFAYATSKMFNEFENFMNLTINIAEKENLQL